MNLRQQTVYEFVAEQIKSRMGAMTTAQLSEKSGMSLHRVTSIIEGTARDATLGDIQQIINALDGNISPVLLKPGYLTPP